MGEGLMATETREHSFTDPVSGRQVTLVFGPEPLTPYDGNHGVRHPDCPELAPVSPDLDCFYCSACQWNGRISGAWFMDLWVEHVRKARA